MKTGTDGGTGSACLIRSPSSSVVVCCGAVERLALAQGGEEETNQQHAAGAEESDKNGEGVDADVADDETPDDTADGLFAVVGWIVHGVKYSTVGDGIM